MISETSTQLLLETEESSLNLTVDIKLLCLLVFVVLCWIITKELFTGYFNLESGRRGGLMVSALDSGVSGLGLSLGWGHSVVFLGKTLYSHSASLQPGV